MMISLMVSIVILGLMYWVFSLIPLPAPFSTLIKVLFILTAVLMLLNTFGIGTDLILR